LVRAGVEVVVSATFGKFADKREMQLEPQDAFDYSGAGELWLDYLSDTGDGWDATYTMAYLLAQPSLEIGGEILPRGDVLMLGGDQVYPSAEPEAYEDRFKGPFSSALPQSESGREPHLYATPGNHDWYDGLSSFLRVFCARRWIGGWMTRQRRSYYALKLPSNWWIWAIDIQLDTYLDEPQLRYFTGQALAVGDKVILLTAKPSWTKAEPARVDPVSWRYLSFFEERMVRDRGARLVATITGDTHHYARYEPGGEGAADAPTRITAGGGGAYLSATHTLKPALELRPLGRQTASGAFEQRPVVSYARDQIYPRAADSQRLGNGVVRLAGLNPGLGRLTGGLYALLAVAILGALNAGENRLVEAGTADGFLGFLATAAGGVTVVLALLLFGGIFGGTEIKPGHGDRGGPGLALARLAVALVHTALHLLTAALVVWLALKLAPEIRDVGILVWVLAVPVAFGAGAVMGPTLWGVFLLLVHRTRGSKAPENANQVFSGQSIADYKNFLRIRLALDGALTIFPLGVDRVGRAWDHVGGEGAGARFVPRTSEPVVTLIDGPLQFDRTGNRSR
ncbi:MAG TPA: hypothetical protein VNB64_12520, partial [Solirubrobacteraceae bacterium]|nr:hypothetical protein [Solirubrobacteraceae bacterium]